MAFCAKCGTDYDEATGGCPQCAGAAPPVPIAPYGSPAPAAPVTFTMPTDKPSLMAYGGAALLLVGTFLPALKLSTGALGGLAASVNVEYSLLGGGPGAELMAKSADSPTGMFVVLGVLFAALAVATAFLVLRKMWQPLFASGGIALVVVAYGFFTLTSKIGEAVKAAGAYGKQVSDMIQPGWGWAALLVGAGLILAAAVMKQQESR